MIFLALDKAVSKEKKSANLLAGETRNTKISFMLATRQRTTIARATAFKNRNLKFPFSAHGFFTISIKVVLTPILYHKNLIPGLN